MAHWHEKYIGLPYELGEFDCGHLAIVVQKEVFGRVINVPGERKANAFQSLSDEIAAYRYTVSEKTDTPKEGDGVLMIARKHLYHVGIYFEINGTGYVLHNMAKFGVCSHRIRDLHKYALDIEGYYRFKEESEQENDDKDCPQQTPAITSGR